MSLFEIKTTFTIIIANEHVLYCARRIIEDSYHIINNKQNYLKNYLLHDYMSQIHEIAKRKLSQKKVETDFFGIKMVLLIFTAIIEALKYSF